MRITYQKDGSLSLIYIYLREFDGNIVGTIPYTKANMLFDRDGNWIGVEVFNLFTEDDKLKLILPVLRNPYIPNGNEYVECSNDKIYILFDKSLEVYRKMGVGCNIDHNKTGGLQGIEFILNCFNAKMDIVNRFISK